MNNEVSEFLRELVAKLDAGQPLHSSLLEFAESDETAPALRPVIEQLADSIGKGSNFSRALAKHPTVFDPGYVALLGLFEDEMTKAGGPVQNAPAS